MSTESLEPGSAESVEDRFQETVAGALLAGILMLTREGMTPNKAMRVVVIEYLQNQFGSEVWKELGVASRTIDRWRAEAREHMADIEVPEEIPHEILEIFIRLQGGGEK